MSELRMPAKRAIKKIMYVTFNEMIIEIFKVLNQQEYAYTKKKGIVVVSLQDFLSFTSFCFSSSGTWLTAI